MAFFVRTGINNITAMYEEVEAEEVRPVFGTQFDETTSSSKFDSGIGGVSLDHDLNTSAASSSTTSSSFFSDVTFLREKLRNSKPSHWRLLRMLQVLLVWKMLLVDHKKFSNLKHSH